MCNFAYTISIHCVSAFIIDSSFNLSVSVYRYPMTTGDNHRFWDKQPISIDPSNKSIQACKDVSISPVPLPYGLVFETVKPSEYRDIYEFLRSNYVEDSTQVFRLIYSYEFLYWEFTGKHTCSDYCVSVKKENKIVGFIFAKIHNIVINGQKEKFASVNYLCIERGLRGKNIAPLMISEIQRRVNLKGISCAIFTGSINLPFKISYTQYYHKVLNCEYLVNCNFINYFVTYQRFTERKCRRACRTDIDEIRRLHDELKTYSLYEEFDADMLSCDDNIMQFFVIEDKNLPNRLCAFGSFYFLSSLNVKKNMEIKAVYLMHLLGTEKMLLLKEMVDIAYEQGVHVFNSLGLASRDVLLKELEFLAGTGYLNYYLFNYGTLPIPDKHISFVLF